MGYNVSPEVMNAFREKNAAGNAWKRKRIMKRLVILVLIAIVVFFVFRSVRVNGLRKMVSGSWDKIFDYNLELIDDGRYRLTSDDAQIRGIYKIGLQCDGEEQRWNAEHGSYYRTQLTSDDVYIDFLNSDGSVLLYGIYNAENDTIVVFKQGSYEIAYRVE